MKFFVERTSIWRSDETPPCEGLTSIKVIEQQPYYSNTLYYWTIELNSLEELIDFVKKHSDIVISEKQVLGNQELVIEIYDSYRE